ncbi:DNA-binding protein [Wenzhouxiangella sp. EGI_FJ10409]|uniref:DNA-binding protein n=1 Tax=Wenzhouxiangella sp. EGI_FJ10409 TaxID=3243767 RepID=UPI0035DF2773
MNYNFSLIFRLPEKSANTDDLVEALAECGCDDAMVGTGHPGRIALEFDREAETATAAVDSAVRDVESALPGAELIEATPDLVGLTDIAEIAGISRQALRKLMQSRHDFPRPAHCGNPSLWHLAPMLDWLDQEERYDVAEALRAVSQQTLRLNTQIQNQQARIYAPQQTATA